MNNEYTGREIAIFTDVHGLLEPLEAILEDIKNRNITEIYSLGDNIGDGPNPKEVLNLLEKHKVKSIAGNSEDYITLGTEPFSYIKDERIKECNWTLSKLDNHQIKNLKIFPHTIELFLGNKRIALCHFANDVRFDFRINSTWGYQKRINANDPNANAQFLYTNSKEQQEEIEEHIQTGKDEDKGYISAYNDPLFYGKKITSYDEVIQGHNHFKHLIEGNGIKVRTIRALAMAYNGDQNNLAFYIILKEKQDGYDVEEVLVQYDRNKMHESIEKSDMPNKEKVKKITNLLNK